MKQLSFYKILTLILIPVGFLFAFNTLGNIIATLGNPPLLLITFIMACMPLYIFTSSYFFMFGIQKARPCNASLKDWIKVNAVVTLLFSALMLFTTLMFLLVSQNPKLVEESLKQMPASQQEIMSHYSLQQINSFIKIMVAIMLPLSIVLIIHIILTFGLLKKYNHVFNNS